jgi:hypothetical protein
MHLGPIKPILMPYKIAFRPKTKRLQSSVISIIFSIAFFLTFIRRFECKVSFGMNYSVLREKNHYNLDFDQKISKIFSNIVSVKVQT